MRQSYALLGPPSVLLIATLLVSSCSLGRSSPPPRLYTLTAMARADGNPHAAGTQNLAIGVGPVELPHYVDRPQIVTGDSGNELQQASLAQWAEPLDTNFARVLTLNLALLLATDRVAVFPWQGPVPLDYQVVIEVTQFVGTPGGSVTLAALWRVLGKEGREPLMSRQSILTDTTDAQEYSALAAAMSRTVASLSREIATALTALAPNPLP